MRNSCLVAQNGIWYAEKVRSIRFVLATYTFASLNKILKLNCCHSSPESAGVLVDVHQYYIKLIIIF